MYTLRFAVDETDYDVAERVKPDWPVKGKWLVFRAAAVDSSGNTRPAECVAVNDRIPGFAHAYAQTWATRELHCVGVRTVRWEQEADSDPSVWNAVTGAPFGSWAVRVYKGRGDIMWRIGDGCRYIGPGGASYPDADELARRQGPLIPVEVDNLPGLVDELLILRATAGYTTGPDECFEGDCDDGDACQHLQQEYATAAEAIGYHRVLHVLEDLRRRATVAPENTHHYTAGELAELDGVMQAVNAITEALDS